MAWCSSCESKGRGKCAPKGKGHGEGQTGWPDRTLEFWILFSNQYFCGLRQITYLLWAVIFLVCKTRSSDTSIQNFCYYNVCVREAVSFYIQKWTRSPKTCNKFQSRIAVNTVPITVDIFLRAVTTATNISLSSYLEISIFIYSTNSAIMSLNWDISCSSKNPKMELGPFVCVSAVYRRLLPQPHPANSIVTVSSISPQTL